MNFLEYQASALRTARSMGSTVNDLVHAQIGILTEAGEFASEVKRCAIYGAALDQAKIDHMHEELGDILWYIAVACDALGTTMKSLAEANIAKLEKRYPSGTFTPELAEARLDKGGLSARES